MFPENITFSQIVFSQTAKRSGTISYMKYLMNLRFAGLLDGWPDYVPCTDDNLITKRVFEGMAVIRRTVENPANHGEIQSMKILHHSSSLELSERNRKIEMDRGVEF